MEYLQNANQSQLDRIRKLDQEKRETQGNVVRMHDKLKEMNNRLLVQTTLQKEKEERNIEKIELLERRIQMLAE